MKTWQVLDVGSIWMKEFASALGGMEPVVAWAPRMTRFGLLRDGIRSVTLPDPPLAVLEFPLQRGYSRTPLQQLVPFERRLCARILRRAQSPEECPLICSTPFYAPLAELWPGPVIYYVTDLTVAYSGLDPAQVLALDERMCRVARIVCPNSRRIARYLELRAGCAAEKVTVVPNATREVNVLPQNPGTRPGELPKDVCDLPRPIAGVIGNLGGNMDWALLAETIVRTPGISWLFVGPCTAAIADSEQDAAREWVKTQAHFVGSRPYGQLQAYARAFDVAVLPYRRLEPTFSGSSTRFYEHLAATRPMLATRGFAELLEKEPLLRLVDTADEMTAALDELAASGFADGCEEARWEASRVGTWQERARTMRDALQRSETGSVLTMLA